MDQFSPKSSPRGSRSPNVAAVGSSSNAMDVGGTSGGNLKLSIALSGQKPTIIQKGPFYLVKPEPLPVSDVTGATNLMALRGLEHSYVKLTTKKMKDSLSSFLPNLPGFIDTPGSQDNSSLRGLIEKPPVCGKELLPLSNVQLAGFRLHPGPLPEPYRFSMQPPTKKKRKHKKNKHRGSETPGHDDSTRSSTVTMGGSASGGASGGVITGGIIGSSGVVASSNPDDEREKRREKKHKKHDKDAEERKRRRKEKKRKKNKEDKE